MSNFQTTILTPCIGICELDDQGLCEGCHRSSHEIASWSIYNDDQRAHIMNNVLPKREAQRV